MSAISTFEQNTRDTLAISVLNKFRRWSIGRDAKLTTSKSEIILKAISALKGESQINDEISFYFKDSGETENLIVFQLKNVFEKVLGDDQKKKEKFFEAISKILEKLEPNALPDDELKFIQDTVEKSIYFIDNKISPVTVKQDNQSYLDNTMGF
jgi:hypothetical protein